MKNKFKLHFSKLKIVLTTSAIVLLLVLFFSPNKTIKAEEKDYDISFYIDELNSYSLTYSEGETISEIPTLNSDYFFVGWYDNESFDGANYFATVVSELTPNNLYRSE